MLTGYAWPGNVRELENALERAVLLTDATIITPDNLPEKVWVSAPVTTPVVTPRLELPTPEAANYSLKRAIAIVEERFIRAALRRTRGNRTRAAELLELSARALLYKLKDYSIDADAEGEKGPEATGHPEGARQPLPAVGVRTCLHPSHSTPTYL